jgi:hypothetical protein
MAMSQAANLLEKVIGHDGSAVNKQDISNPAIDRSKYADPSGETMKALLWQGKNTIEVRMSPQHSLSPPTGSFDTRKMLTSLQRTYQSHAS